MYFYIYSVVLKLIYIKPIIFKYNIKTRFVLFFYSSKTIQYLDNFILIYIFLYQEKKSSKIIVCL